MKLEKKKELIKLSSSDIHLRFLLNQAVEIDGLGSVFSPKLTAIANLSELVYNQVVSLLLFNKNDLDRDFGEYSNFDVLILHLYHDSSLRELFLQGLKLHFTNTPYWYQDENTAYIYFDELSEDSILTAEKFEYLQLLVRIANNISIKEKEDYVLANKAAQKLLEKIKKNRSENTAKPPETINLHSIISSVAWKNKSFDFISELNIYQLYDGYSRSMQIDNYHYTMSGIYAGTVDNKQIKLPEIHWANIIKQN